MDYKKNVTPQYLVVMFLFLNCKETTYKIDLPHSFCGDTLVYNGYFKEFTSNDFRINLIRSNEIYIQGLHNNTFHFLFYVDLIENLQDSFILHTRLLIKKDSLQNYYLDQASFIRNKKPLEQINDSAHYIVNPVTGEANEITSNFIIRKNLTKLQIDYISHLFINFDQWNSDFYDKDAKINYSLHDYMKEKSHFTSSNKRQDKICFEIYQAMINLSNCNSLN